MLEIEKSFLVKKVPSDLKKYKSCKIKQGYFSYAPQPLRIRKKDNFYEITKKINIHQDDYKTADEINIPLKPEEFDRLWPLTICSLEKTRYFIPLKNDLVAELDVFEGKLAGIVFVEVEFKSEEAGERFIPPDWFGADVTQEQFCSNVFLAGKNFEEISKIIKNKNY